MSDKDIFVFWNLIILGCHFSLKESKKEISRIFNLKIEKPRYLSIVDKGIKDTLVNMTCGVALNYVDSPFKG